MAKQIKQNKKQKQQAGFTLIELLAVITIMGILMMVAIPSVQRTIENSRRDTFANTAKTYLNQVRNEVLADNITCGGVTASALSEGLYYFPLATAENTSIGTTDNIVQQTTDLMEKGGKSAWSNLNVYGYVIWENKANTTTGKVNSKYYIALWDEKNHGTVKSEASSTKSNYYKAVPEDQVNRTNTLSKLAYSNTTINLATYRDAVECTLR